MQHNTPYIVGISGGSASGKSHLLDLLQQQYSAVDATFISLDNYYRPFEEQPRDEQGQVNFDHPQAIDAERFLSDLEHLCQGRPVHLKEYNFNNPHLPQRNLTYHPAPILLIEGLFVFCIARIASQLDLRVFVDADEHIKFSRRIVRDFHVRGYALEDIIFQYTEYVIPMYRKYVEPYRLESDLVLINHENQLERGARVLVDHLHSVLQRTRMPGHE